MKSCACAACAAATEARISSRSFGCAGSLMRSCTVRTPAASTRCTQVALSTTAYKSICGCSSEAKRIDGSDRDGEQCGKVGPIEREARGRRSCALAPLPGSRLPRWNRVAAILASTTASAQTKPRANAAAALAANPARQAASAAVVGGGIAAAAGERSNQPLACPVTMKSRRNLVACRPTLWITTPLQSVCVCRLRAASWAAASSTPDAR